MHPVRPFGTLLFNYSNNMGFKVSKKQNIIEQKILANVLLDNKKILYYIDFFKDECFSTDLHNDIAKIIYEKISSNELADPVTLRNRLQSLETLKNNGGMKYILELLLSVKDNYPEKLDIEYPSIENLKRIYLSVPYNEKDIVKYIGAKWDGYAKIWYVPSNIDPNLFSRWFTIIEDKTNKS